MPWGDLDATILELLPRLRDIRQDLHKHPELGFEETRTQARVRAWLEGLGYQPRDCAKTGLIADLHLDAQPGPRIALRADLDALPMQETTELSYRSVHDGRAHKCGHDGHTAILLGVAALLARHRESFKGNVRLIFQPAEEGVDGGGARVMLEEGALSGVDEIYGLHNWPGFPKGQVRVNAGPAMAQVFEFETQIVGRGGHASQPQVCLDPIVAGSALVLALQTLISRSLSAHEPAVLSVGSFQAGHANNVIPGHATLRGTIRCFDAQVGARLEARFHEVCAGIAQSHGVSIEPGLRAGYPVLVNDPQCASVVNEVATDLLGKGACSARGLPLSASEDFAYFTQTTRGAYFFLGAGEPNAPGKTPGCHHPDFDFDDDLLGVGMRMFMGIVERRLSPAPA